MPVNRIAVLCAVLIVASTATAQLPAGNYTIDPSLGTGGNNFPSWASAVAALASGVSGPGGLTFTVASTTFNETVNFATTITGTSAFNSVTFIAIGSPAIINAGGMQDAFTVNGAQSYLNFENIQIQNFTRYGLNVQGTNSTTRASFCNFRRMVVDGPMTTSTTVMTVRTYYCSDTAFEDCVFKGGGYVHRGESTARAQFRRCEFDGKGTASRLVYPFNNNDADNLWSNCFLHDCAPNGLGMDISVSGYGNMFWHNTIIVTTSSRAVNLRSCCAWTRSNSFRNNIVVNLGTGIAITYGSGTGAPGILEFNDIDNNCYYAPNGFANEVAQQLVQLYTTGTLAAWLAWLGTHPLIIPAGGGTSWDQNSIEANPMLVSMVAPYDIHLQAGSPCIDAGTSNFAPGVWMTNPSGFTVPDDFEGNARPMTGRDIGADELSCPVPQYETNNAASSLAIDNLQGSACFPAVSVKNQGAPVPLTFASTNVGLGWEAVIATASLVPASAGGIVTGGGQILNINFGASSVSFLNGGAAPSFATPFPGNFLLGFSAPPFPFIASIQMANVDPTNPDGLALSQGCELNVP